MNNQSMFLTPVSYHECMTIIQNLNTSNNTIDKVPSRILKKFRFLISAPICDIINLSFSLAIYPNSLKYAVITPLFKKGDPKSPSNYRPISVTSFLNKIFEKAIHTRISNFLSFNSIISTKQFGFIKGSSTQDALYNLSEFY